VSTGEAPALRSHLLAGTVRHRRRRHTTYDFTHRLWYLALDIDEIDEAARRLWVLSVNRRNLLELRDADHLRGDRPIREEIRGRIASAGLDPDALRTTLIAYPRVVGYVFNPVSFYLCHDRDTPESAAGLRLVLAEVHNTHGDRTVYIFLPSPGRRVPGPVFHAQEEKRMYVSPFIGREARYDLSVWEDADGLSIAIHEHEGAEASLFAAVRLARMPLTQRALWGLLLRDPLVPLKTTALIFLHAFRLWLRGVPWQRYRRAGRGSDTPDPRQ
jgi:uncharacterized protein